MEKRLINNTTQNLAGFIALVFCAIYALAFWFPESFWGLHHIAFLPPILKYTFLISALGGLGLFHFKTHALDVFGNNDLPFNKWLVIGMVATIAGVIYYQFPIAANVYGDSELFSQKMGDATTEYNPLFLTHLLSPDVTSPKSGNLTVLSGIRLLSLTAEISHQQAYRILGMVSGMVYVIIWMHFVLIYFQDNKLRVTMLIVGLFTPFTQLFFGYQEIYAPAIPAFTAYLCNVLIWFKTKKKTALWSLPFLLLFCLKFHSSAYMLAPSLLMIFSYHFLEQKQIATNYFSWENIAFFLIIPALLGGAVVYFFMLHAHNEPRFLGSDVDIYTRLFLPLVNDEAPLDHYSLLHFNHFLDYFNLLFIWSSAAIVILIICAFSAKKFNWKTPEVIVLGTTLFLFALLFFMINPLMSMPYDWDYFSLPGPVLILFLASLLSQYETSDLRFNSIGIALTLTLLTLPRFIVNANTSALSNRLETTGKHVFKTYWIRSAGDISAAINLDQNQSPSRHLKVVADLKPYANAGNDIEYANLLWQTGKRYRNLADFESALYYHQHAQSYDSNLSANYIGLMECNYMLKHYAEAWKFSKKLIEIQYPSQKKALQIGIQCALWAEEYETALDYCETYVQQWPEDGMLYIRDQLRNGSNLPNLKFQFQN